MTDAAPAPTASPAARLEAAYRTIQAERMGAIPILNRALAVEALGFAPWGGCWLGVLVTPWFMNLMMLPADASAWVPLAPGAKRTYVFPSGHYEFIGGFDPGVGEYQMCSLFSPMFEFPDMTTARLTGEFALAALLDPAQAETPASHSGPDLVRASGEPISKRDFLRGRFWSEPHEPGR